MLQRDLLSSKFQIYDMTIQMSVFQSFLFGETLEANCAGGRPGRFPGGFVSMWSVWSYVIRQLKVYSDFNWKNKAITNWKI